MKKAPPTVMNFMTSCTMMDKTRVPDGLGGNKTAYKPGAPFVAAIVKEKSLQARVAEKEGVTSVYTITTPEGVGLEYHDVFRRDSDGATFRATSDHKDSTPPERTTFGFEQVSAERWEIPG